MYQRIIDLLIGCTIGVHNPNESQSSYVPFNNTISIRHDMKIFMSQVQVQLCSLSASSSAMLRTAVVGDFDIGGVVWLTDSDVHVI